MLQNSSEFNSVGGGYGGFGGFGGGGFGGIGLFGLLGLRGIGDLDGRDGRRGGCDNDDSCAREAAILSAISNSKDATVAEGRALGAAICATDASIKDAQFALALQSERNTAQLSAQAQAFAIQADRTADEIKAAGVAQTAAILARINDAEVQRLRDELEITRRGRDNRDLEIRIENNNTNLNAQFQAQAQLQLQAQLEDERRRWYARENEINIINTNTNINAQAQSQAQAQAIRDVDRDHRWNNRFDTLISQNAKVAQDIVNINGTVAANQTSSPTNVNSKQ